MGVNVFQPHVLVLPEDDANRQLANGFLLDPRMKVRNIQVLPECGGWAKVLGSFMKNHIFGLQQHATRHLILLIDFDNKFEDRCARFKEEFPPEVQNRVYLLGTAEEPETLRKACGNSYELIGQRLSAECAGDGDSLWHHAELAHNAPERARLNHQVKDILFK